MRRWRVAVLVAVVVSGAEAKAARATDEPEKSGKKNGEHTEFDLVPIVGGSSDIGVGPGAVGALTRFAPDSGQRKGEQRWEWRVEASAFATVRASSGFRVPYQDHWLLLTLPRLDNERLRLTARVAFTSENNIDYFGVGDAAPLPPDSGNTTRYQYGRTHPTVESNARVAIVSHLYATFGGSLTLNWLSVPPDGKLAHDMAQGSPEVRKLLGTARTNAVALAQESVSWDSRDDEVIPHRGSWHELQIRMSPSIAGAFPYSYAEVLGIARTYIPVGSRMVLALRGLGDALIGDPPFFTLATYDDTYALGGSAGIRGVPGPRYYGRAKLIGNVELRTDVVRFHALSKPWAISLVPFFDGGRLWADWSYNPTLDGTGLGLKFGTGLGIRVQQGLAFVVRGDVAWSPDAQPIGGYFAAGETF